MSKRESNGFLSAIVEGLAAIEDLQPKDCLLTRQLIAFAAKPKGRFWKSPKLFLAAAEKQKRFARFFGAGQVPIDPAMIAMLIAVISQIMENKPEPTSRLRPMLTRYRYPSLKRSL